jgi:excinuclease ABC subunit C
MVVFEDGLARKSEYRRFAINGATDDVSAISEVLRRRFSRYRQALTDDGAPAVAEADGAPTAADADGAPTAADAAGLPVAAGASAVPCPEAGAADRPGIDPETGRPRRFAYPPQLVVVDGGQPQVNAAGRVLADLGVTDVAVCGLAKRLEEVWQPDEDFPLILPRTSEGLYLLQRVRDEAHRFAITYHRQKRSKRMIASDLDSVPGLGEVRRKALLRHFGSVKRLKAATVEEIIEVPGIGRRTAEVILAALGQPAATVTPANGGPVSAQMGTFPLGGDSDEADGAPSAP